MNGRWERGRNEPDPAAAEALTLETTAEADATTEATAEVAPAATEETALEGREEEKESELWQNTKRSRDLLSSLSHLAREPSKRKRRTLTTRQHC